MFEKQRIQSFTIVSYYCISTLYKYNELNKKYIIVQYIHTTKIVMIDFWITVMQDLNRFLR